MSDRPGTSKGDTGRLTSLKSRDLNLSGTRPKKTYTPNLNVVRNKTKAVPNLVSSPSNRKTATRNSTKKEFTKHAQHERYIQSTGIFSEGTGTAVKKPSGERSAEHADIAAMEMPTVDKDAAWDIDVKEENEVISSLLDFVSDPDQPQQTYDYQPIVLPLVKNKDDFFANFSPKSPMEGIVKSEPNTHSSSNGETAPTSVLHSMLTTPHIFDKDNVGLTLIKLPSSLPGKGFDEDDKVVDYTLDKMSEGQIGRLLLRQSGKVELEIGDHTFPLETIDASMFREEVVVVPKADSSEPETTSELTCLGVIQEKAVVSPAWAALIPTKKKS